MGSTIFKNTIYISKDLDAILTPRERMVVKAHEVKHWISRDRVRLLFASPFIFLCPPLFNYIRRRIEDSADKFAVLKTKDPDAFISLLDKLQRDSTHYPAKDCSIKMAHSLRSKLNA